MRTNQTWFWLTETRTPCLSLTLRLSTMNGLGEQPRGRSRNINTPHISSNRKRSCLSRWSSPLSSQTTGFSQKKPPKRLKRVNQSSDFSAMVRQVLWANVVLVSKAFGDDPEWTLPRDEEDFQEDDLPTETSGQGGLNIPGKHHESSRLIGPVLEPIVFFSCFH